MIDSWFNGMENNTEPLSTEPDTATEPATAPVLKEAVAAFLADIAAGHSPATVKTYRVGLSRFQLYLQNQLGLDPAALPVSDLKPDWAVGCVRWIAAGQPATPNQAAEPAAKPGPRTPKTTVATYIAGLSRFYRWCAMERWLALPADDYERMAARLKDLRGKVQRTILDKVPADDILDALLAEARRLPETPPAAPVAPDEVRSEGEPGEKPARFRGNARKMAESDARRYQLLRLRNVALLETLKCTGARVSELTGLNRADLDSTNRRARVVGKGSKERWVYFSPAAWEAVQLYLRSRSRLMGEAAALKSGTDAAATAPLRSIKGGTRARSQAADLGGQPLFARHDRGAGWREVKPLLPHAIETMLWELVESAGLEVKITPHRFRHWFATRMLSATGDLATTQDLLGHANPATTRIYAQVSETNKQKAHREVFG